MQQLPINYILNSLAIVNTIIKYLSKMQKPKFSNI